MSGIDIGILVVASLLFVLLFLQPMTQDKLAGFLSGSTDVLTSHQQVKEKGTTKIVVNLTFFFLFVILVLLIIARLT